MKTHTQHFLQKRKFYMALPVMTLPFLTIMFWALGGGKTTPTHASPVNLAGLNASLPDAYFANKEVWDKFSLYETAARDSAKFEEARESDPYFDLVSFEATQQKSEEPENNLMSAFKQKQRLADPNEEKVNKKLEELYRELEKANKPASAIGNNTSKLSQDHADDNFNLGSPAVNSDPDFAQDVSRLESMMEMMNTKTEEDPEMKQLENMLDKILDIQHPERTKEKYLSHPLSESIQSFSVMPAAQAENMSSLSQANNPIINRDSAIQFGIVYAQHNGFFGLNDEISTDAVEGNAIQAVIHDDQELVAGSIVRLRLLQEITVSNILIPKNQFIHGVCSIHGERLAIEVTSIRSGNSLLPVKLSAYDLDGLEGVHIPGAIARDAAKQASDSAMQNVEISSLDTSLAAQAAEVGVEAAKGLFGKKAKMIRITVKAGYKVLLQNTQSGQ